MTNGQPTVSAILPVHDKPLEVFQRVLESLLAQPVNQMVAVADRAPEAILALLEGKSPIVLQGPAGWRSPCIAANAGLQRVTGEITVYCPSDVVMAPDYVRTLKELVGVHPAVYFAEVLESDPARCVGPGHAGPVLCSSTNPRPLTFLFAAPTEALRAIGGWDEAFMDGVCYEDDDLMARLWERGLDFIFDDRLRGEHQTHDRSYFQPTRIAPNQEHMLRKHGTTTFFQREIRNRHITIRREPGRMEWSRL